VMLKFLLLERRRIALAEVAPLLAAIPLVVRTNRRFIGSTDEELARWAISQLLRAAAARIDGADLLDQE
jgi:hypothetical protein